MLTFKSFDVTYLFAFALKNDHDDPAVGTAIFTATGIHKKITLRSTGNQNQQFHMHILCCGLFTRHVRWKRIHYMRYIYIRVHLQ